MPGPSGHVHIYVTVRVVEEVEAGIFREAGARHPANALFTATATVPVSTSATATAAATAP